MIEQCFTLMGLTQELINQRLNWWLIPEFATIVVESYDFVVWTWDVRSHSYCPTYGGLT